MSRLYNAWLLALNLRGASWDDADVWRPPTPVRYHKGDQVRVTAAAGQQLAPPLPPPPSASDESTASDPVARYLLGAFGNPFATPEPAPPKPEPAPSDYAGLVGGVEAVGWYWDREAIGATPDAPVCVHVYRVQTPPIGPGKGGDITFWAEEWALSPA